MGLFGRAKEGGFMDVIRCDETEYLVWKWTPHGTGANTTKKENSIRYGSRLRVKDGEVAVFFYTQNNGTVQDFIVGPYDGVIETANFPILTGIVGTAFGGNSPFQAEVYFINLQKNNLVRFGVPYFDVFDPRFLDFPVPVAVRGTITFNISDYKTFIKNNRLVSFDHEAFSQQIKDAVRRHVKTFVTSAPSKYNIPVLQLETKIQEVNSWVQSQLEPIFEEDYGVNLRRFDISAIEPDKESNGYIELRNITARQQEKTIAAQTEVNIKNLYDTQRINAENLEETLRIQREESQRAQRLQTESNNLGAHALNQQTEVLKTAAESLGQMGTMDMGGGSGSMNPAGMMTGMMMGGAMGGQMANMMNTMGNTMQQQMATPPPVPTVMYFAVLNNQQSGPYNVQQITELVRTGQMNANTLVWTQGMPNWIEAANVQDLANIFNNGSMPPPIPTTI